MKRQHISDRMKLDALLWHQPPKCFWCHEPMTIHQPRHWDHAVPLALGGKHDFDNIRPMHANCHGEKTNGDKATVANGDIHKIAKAKRLLKAKEVHDAIVRKEAVKAASRLKSRGFQKGASGFSKQQSRNWGAVK